MRYGFGLLAFLLLSGCGSSTAPTPLNGTYPVIQTRILTPYCVRCHTNFGEYSSLVSSGYVVPGDPLSSKLYLEVALGEMPKGGPRLSDEQVMAIRDWVAGGALP